MVGIRNYSQQQPYYTIGRQRQMQPASLQPVKQFCRAKKHQETNHPNSHSDFLLIKIFLFRFQHSGFAEFWLRF
jgi:hypothetical protein